MAGIKPESSRILVRFVTAEPQWELLKVVFKWSLLSSLLRWGIAFFFSTFQTQSWLLGSYCTGSIPPGKWWGHALLPYSPHQGPRVGERQAQWILCWSEEGDPGEGRGCAQRDTFPFYFFWLYLWHVDAPRPGIKPAPEQQPEPMQWQHQILYPLCRKRTPHTCILDAFFHMGILRRGERSPRLCLLGSKRRGTEPCLVRLELEFRFSENL